MTMTATEPLPPGAEPRCGGQPKPLAIGIAPLGIVAIGIVPMGVVSIGIVPMGVVSIGAVAMGLVNAAVVGMGVLVGGVNAMGVWWSAPHGMGPYRLGDRDNTNRLAYPSRQQALEQAKLLGCEGAHAMGRFWMPCRHH